MLLHAFRVYLRWAPRGPLSLSVPHPCAYPNSVAQENTPLGIVTPTPTSKAAGVQALQEIAQLCSDKNPAATFGAGGGKPHLPHLGWGHPRCGLSCLFLPSGYPGPCFLLHFHYPLDQHHTLDLCVVVGTFVFLLSSAHVATEHLK